MKNLLKPKIKEVAVEAVLNIRHDVMWPNKPFDYVRIPNDEKGKHFGLFLEDKLVSVVSLFIENNEAQFRKFATLPDYQNQGFGTHLLKEIIRIAEEQELYKIWCNARVDKSAYYLKFGMTLTNSKFEKGGIKYVIMEKLFNKA